MERLRSLAVRLRAPLGIYLLSAGVYVAVLGARRLEHSPDDHFVRLATSFLEGRLDQGGDPPGTNDWACYDREIHGACPNGVFHFPESQHERYRWYVSFPPFPALVILPAVALFGPELADRLFWALVAGLGPSSLFVLLRRLRELGESERTARDDLLLTSLFAFGTAFFFVAVQGTVWFAAHVVAVPLLSAFVGASVGARRPFLAGLTVGLAFLTRPPMALFGLFFVAEAIRASAGTPVDGSLRARASAFDAKRAGRTLALFAVPAVLACLVAMAMNQARFEDPFEFGHEYLQIFWRPRIEKWGLFNYHYVARNLSVFLAGLPWLSRNAPHVVISAHGLAIWVTTPPILYALWPARTTPLMRTLTPAVLAVLVLDLMYQNSGWIQFGYRFALDYLPAVFVLLALGNVRFGWLFRALTVVAFVVNTFGAITFDRAMGFYHVDGSQSVYFQPD